MKKVRDRLKSEGLGGNARHMAETLVLLDLNIALRRLILVHEPYYGLYRYVRSNAAHIDRPRLKISETCTSV